MQMKSLMTFTIQILYPSCFDGGNENLGENSKAMANHFLLVAAWSGQLTKCANKLRCIIENFRPLEGCFTMICLAISMSPLSKQ